MLNRAYSLLEVKSVDDEKRIITGIASTPTPDLVDDVVEPKGAEFKLPIPFLWQHDSEKPVGHVTKAKITKEGIEVEVRLKKTDEPGSVKDRLDSAWHDIKLGLVRGLSIGFKGIETSRIEETFGTRFVKWMWLELSAVTIAANQEASIISIKQIDASLLAASGHGQDGIDSTSAGVTARKATHVVKAEGAKRIMKKPIAEQISAFEATRQAKSAEMDKIMDDSAEAGETLDAEKKEAYDTLKGEVAEIDEHLIRLREREKTLVSQAKSVEATNVVAAADSRSNVPRVSVARALPKAYGFVRLLGARFMAKEQGVHPAEIAASRGWGQEMVDVLKMPKDIILKAAVAAANTTDSAWAGPLVTYNNLQEEFIALLRAKTLVDRIPGLRRVPFNTKIPREITAMTGYWVGQGSPKPVSAGALDTVTLDFAKVAGITFQTQELLRFSRPNSEQLMINSLSKALIYLIDRDFLDPAKAAATGVSPASITNGATSITASGTSADAFRSDFASLLATYTQNNYNLDSLVIVMTQTQALRLALMVNDFGGKEFPGLTKDGGSLEGIPVITTENIVANGGSPTDGWIIVALNAEDILLADDGAIDVDISTEASIQADSAPDSPTTASTVLVSLWQNNLVGIRCERFITWAKARTTSVVYITGGNYR